MAPAPNAEPKAKAKAEPKAQPAPAAEPKAKAKADAKAKAAPKAQAIEAAPKAKADAKAKADPKAKAANANPKAQAKGEPAPKSAGGKAAAKSKAKAEPAPLPEPEPAEMQVVKSRRRKKKKAEEVGPDEELVEEVQAPGEEELREQERIRSEHDSRHNVLSSKHFQAFKDLPKIDDTKSRDEVLRSVGEQKKALEKLMNDMDEDLKTAKIHRPKNTNLTAILQQKKDLNQMAKGMFSENTKKQMQQDVDSALSQVLAFESFRQFQADMETLRKKCQGRVEENENLAKSVKSNQQQRKLISMIADAKGVKAEDLKESDVASQNMELPTE